MQKTIVIHELSEVKVGDIHKNSLFDLGGSSSFKTIYLDAQILHACYLFLVATFCRRNFAKDA